MTKGVEIGIVTLRPVKSDFVSIVKAPHLVLEPVLVKSWSMNCVKPSGSVQSTL